MLDAAFRRCGVLRVDQHRRPVLHGGSAGQAAAAAGTAPDDRHQRRRSRRAGHRCADRAAAANWPSSPPRRWRRSTRSCRRTGATTIRSTFLGDAAPERYAKALEIAAKDPNSDGLLVILTPQAMTDPTQIAEQLKPYAKHRRQAGAGELDGRRGRSRAGEQILNRAGIPTLPVSRHRGARVQLHVALQRTTCAALYETPALPGDDGASATRPRAHGRDDSERRASAGRTLLTEFESKQLLAAYGIPDGARRGSPPTEDEAVGGRRADRLSGRAQAVLGDHHAQDRCRRRAAEPARRGSRARRRFARFSDVGRRRRPAPGISRA